MDTLVGIDFGTTNTVVTLFNNNKAIPILDGVFKTIPSKIAKINDKFYCGNYIPLLANNILHSFKLSIGNNMTFTFGDNITYTHSDILIIFFKHIHDLIKKNSTGNIKAVITVPSNFNDTQREIIKSCFNSVGINVIRIINEPSSAALAYGLNYSTKSEEKILVIDTGGGTMDFTVLEKIDTFFEVIHSEGLNDLGGNNFTELIVNDMKRTLNCLNDNILWLQAQKIKEKLTYLNSYEVKINNIHYNLERVRFENMSSLLIEKMSTVLKNIISEYKIEYIILVGGTSRIPIVQEIIHNITKIKPWVHPNLETVVAEGGGLYCGIIENKFTINNDVVLLDVIPLSLGVELVDGSYSIIIPKNTPLPVKRSQKYTTDSPSDSSVEIKVYQGERMIANKNFLIGEFIFDKISMCGLPIIEISFRVDSNSIINVTVIDRKSGIEKSIIIKDIPVIENSQINNLIEQAIKLSDIDMAELSKSQNIYLIRTHIENALANIQINDMISTEDKNNMIKYFNDMEESINNMNNMQLLETLNNMQEKYSILNSSQTINENNEYDEISKILFEEKKKDLKHKIELLLVRNQDWEEFLNPVLEELSYNTVTEKYVDDKYNLLKDLESLSENKDYKKELNNLCLYLKTEINCGNIKLDNMDELVQLINTTLDMILNDSQVDWEKQINIFNNKCEQLYNISK